MNIGVQTVAASDRNFTHRLEVAMKGGPKAYLYGWYKICDFEELKATRFTR